jgi:hypothetical protein
MHALRAAPEIVESKVVNYRDGVLNPSLFRIAVVRLRNDFPSAGP